VATVVFLLSLAMTLGAAWTARRISNNSGISAKPDIAVWGQNIYLVWQDTSDVVSYYRIYFSKSADGGATWQTPKMISNDYYYCGDPKIAVSGSNVYVVWYDSDIMNPPYDREITFTKSSDGGATWQTAVRLTNNTGDSHYPDIAVDGSNVYAVWEDDTPGNYDIYFRTSTDGGATWQTAKRLTNNSGSSVAPSIIVSGLNVFVVWNDNTPGNLDTFFRQSTDGGAT